MTTKDAPGSEAAEKQTSSQPGTATDTKETSFADKFKAALGIEKPAEVEEDAAQAADEEQDSPWSLEDDDIRSAWDVLKRDDWKPEHIKMLSREELLDRGKKRARVQADIDRAFSTAKNGKAEASETTEKDQPTPQIDPKALVGNLAATLGLDEAESQPFANAFYEAVQAAVAPLANAVLAMAEHNDSSNWNAARGELLERIPQLEDDSLFQKVRARASKAAQADGHSADRGRYLEAAAVLEGLELVPKSEIERTKKLDKQRSRNTPTPPQGQPKKQALTGTAKIAESIRLMNQGLTRDEVMARLG